MKVARTLWRHARLASMTAGSAWGWVEDGALLTEGERIVWAGPDRGVPRGAGAQAAIQAEHNLHGALVTPGLIDAHTHLVYGGDRAAEFEQRLQGASYEEIARAGGGIRATARQRASCTALRP